MLCCSSRGTPQKSQDQSLNISKLLTTLLFTIDLIKERVGISKMENKEVAWFFDEENPTTPEEVINTKMEELLIKRKGEVNPFLDHIESGLNEHDQLYLNKKS